MGEIRRPEIKAQIPPGTVQRPDPPVVVTQHIEPARTFIILTAQVKVLIL